jgi:hypothetical protein
MDDVIVADGSDLVGALVTARRDRERVPLRRA